jgi:non-ribosomal peptide synthetase component E (peptide arylation enzyme)
MNKTLHRLLALYTIPKGFEFCSNLPQNALGKVFKKNIRLEAQAKRRKS